MVPQTPLMSAVVLREEEEAWMDVQVIFLFIKQRILHECSCFIDFSRTEARG